MLSWMAPLQAAGIKQVNVTGTYPSASRLTAPPTTSIVSTSLVPSGTAPPYPPPAVWQNVPHPSRTSGLEAGAALVLVTGSGSELVDAPLEAIGGADELAGLPLQAANATTLITIIAVMRYR